MWYLCVRRASKYLNAVSDWLNLVADLYGTILVGGPMWAQYDDVVVLAVAQHQSHILHCTQTTLRSLLSKPMDPIPKEDRNNAVYQLNCKDCEVVYVGETKRTLNIRAEKHITTIKSASKRSHTAEHCWNYNHDCN